MRKSGLALLLPFIALACNYKPVPTYSGAHAGKRRPVAKAAAPTPVAERRSIVSEGRVVGSEIVTTHPDGAITLALDVLENGRGPKVDATIRLAADGTIDSFSARGHHTMGTAVEEDFARTNGRAHWKSKEEAGDRDEAFGTFYVPFAEAPSSIGMLAQALLKAGRPMPLLPAGEARIEKTGDATVKANGVERKLVGYAITGLDLVPTRLWMNADGSFFGVVDPWFSDVPQGWESVVDPLVQKQMELDRNRDANLARTIAHRPPPAGVAYTHARVLDVDKGRWSPDQTVVVVGDTIKTIGPSARVQPPAGAEVIDATGKALVPGLWDMHCHENEGGGALDVASGVTSARDVGNDPDKLDDWKRRFDDGSAIGPHLYRFGFIEGRNEKAAASKITAETPEEAVAAVEFFQKRGYEGIKIYNSVKPELVPILAKEAHARGMQVIGHIPVHMLANEAVRAGYDGIEHINMLFLNFFADHDTDTRTTTRFTLVGDKAAGFDLKSKPAQDFFALLKEKKTIVDPTVTAFEELLVGQPGKITPGLEPLVARLPAQTQRWFLAGGVPFEGKEQLYKDSFDKMLAMVKALYDQKITVVTGTDSGLHGLALHHELALFVRAGIPAAAVLRMATLDAAKTLKVDFKTGSIAENKAADLVLVDGDPLAKIEDIGKVVSTMRSGVVYASAPVFDSAGVKPLK